MSGFTLSIIGVVLVVGIAAIASRRFAVRATAVAIFAAIALFTALGMYEGGYRSVSILVERDGGKWSDDAMAGAVAMRQVHKPGAVTLYLILAFLGVLALRRPR